MFHVRHWFHGSYKTRAHLPASSTMTLDSQPLLLRFSHPISSSHFVSAAATEQDPTVEHSLLVPDPHIPRPSSMSSSQSPSAFRLRSLSYSTSNLFNRLANELDRLIYDGVPKLDGGFLGFFSESVIVVKNMRTMLLPFSSLSDEDFGEIMDCASHIQAMLETLRSQVEESAKYLENEERRLPHLPTSDDYMTPLLLSIRAQEWLHLKP